MEEVNNKAKVIVFIYKRNKAKEEDEYISFTYEFVGIKEGLEYIDEDDDIIFADKKENQYEFIDNISHLEDEYVYAFPTYLDDLTKEEKKICIRSVKEEKEIAEYFKLFQVYAKGSDTLVTYSLDPESKDTVDVETTSHYGIDMMCSDKSEVINEVRSSISPNAKTEKENDNEKKNDTPTPVVVYANEMFDNVTKTVICQDDQIKAISATLAKNLRITTPNLKDNLLICGPTGVGKSEIFRCISDYTNIPVVTEDSTEFTAQGYKGKDVTDMLYHLYLAAEGNIEKAQRGIIVIDEIDKKISGNPDNEVYSKAVLDSLLKMAEGHHYKIELPRNGIIDIDTSYITFVMAGAFSGIEKFNETKRSLGFVSQEEKKDQENTKKSYTDKTLIKYGLKPEFLGRSKLVVLNNLGVDELKQIMTTSNKSQLLLYKYMLENMNINFIYEEDTIEAIAKKAIELGVGARSIKKIIVDAFDVINYELFSRNNYKELIITPETIEDNTKYILR